MLIGWRSRWMGPAYWLTMPGNRLMASLESGLLYKWDGAVVNVYAVGRRIRTAVAVGSHAVAVGSSAVRFMWWTVSW
jgi:hypothetical protein